MTRNVDLRCENSRGASVWALMTPITVAVARSDRHAEKRLEPLLLELRHVLHARIVEQVVAE